MSQSLLNSAIASVPAGRWAVAVSGGADSVALLCLLCEQSANAGRELYVVHLNHQLRGTESDADARFVAELSARFGLPCTIGLRNEVEAGMSAAPNATALPKNPSARYRAARLALLAAVVGEHGLDGAIYAHHADDQAETVLQRLIRGSGWTGLCGMGTRSVVHGLLILRPMLAVRRSELQAYLTHIGQPWREDSSNASKKYLRNRLRVLLADRPGLTDELLRLAERCRRLRRWVAEEAPPLDASFAPGELADLPALLARVSASRWLADRGVGRTRAGSGISPRAIESLLEICRDVATPPRRQVSGRVTICRRRGRIWAEGR